MIGEGWSPPRWMYRDRRPPNDDAYFENMTRVIFLAELSRKASLKKEEYMPYLRNAH